MVQDLKSVYEVAWFSTWSVITDNGIDEFYHVHFGTSWLGSKTYTYEYALVDCPTSSKCITWGTQGTWVLPLVYSIIEQLRIESLSVYLVKLRCLSGKWFLVYACQWKLY